MGYERDVDASAAAGGALTCRNDVVGVAAGHFGDGHHAASFDGIKGAGDNALQHADAVSGGEHCVVGVVRHCSVSTAAA